MSEAPPPVSPDKNMERLPEYVRLYGKDKSSLTRFAGTFALLSLIVAFAARTPSIRVGAESLGIVKGEVHSGYLLVYGEPVIFIAALVYWMRLADSYAMFEAIRQSLTSHHGFSLLPVERVLLEPPFTISWRSAASTRWDRILSPVLRWSIPMVVPFLAFVCYLTLIGGFFHDLLPCHRLLDLLFGIDTGLNGFKPSADLPYVYFFNTWANIIGVFIMAFLLVWSGCRMWQINRSVGDWEGENPAGESSALERPAAKQTEGGR
jgi:hypothetical protein